MKIIDIQFYYYKAPFHSPITTPKVEMTHRKALIVRFISDEGKIILVNVMHLKRIGMILKQLRQ